MSKKGSKAAKEVTSYETRDIVLGKVRGYPPWPGMVVDPESVPPAVMKERPGSKKTTFYCVRFFPTGDYAWLVPKDISKLQIHEIEAYITEPVKQSGDLLSGYRIALDPKKWEEERDAAHIEAGEEEANAEIDQLESENEEGEPKKATKTKKRKRESDAAPTPKPKAKSRAKKEVDDPAPKKKTPAAKTKKNGAKSKAMIESEDEGEQVEPEPEDEDAGPSKKASPPPAKKPKREKEDEDGDATLTSDPEALKVREWRHRLQKTFLSNKSLPKEDDMPSLDNLFTTVENYDKINIQYLSFSKIGKVMRHIAVLAEEKVPRDEEFKFRDRAKALVDKWHQILNANKPNGAEGANGGTKSEGEPQDGVTEGTAALDLNGKGEDESPVPPGTADAVGDASVLADVTMSDA